MKNKATLIGWYGGDNTHSLAAWSSTFLDLDLELPAKITGRVDLLINHIINNSKRIRNVEQLLDYLAKYHHTSPFRFSMLHFVTTTDIATHIHFLKHSVAMYAENAESARYKELQEDKFYLPDDWNGINVNFDNFNSYDDLTFKGIETWKQLLENYTEIGNRMYHECLKQLTPVLGKKRAKESARFFKTYNSQINSSKMMSFEGFLQIYNKRGKHTEAQIEIADVVEQMLNEIKNIEGNPFKYSLQAFNL